MYEPDKFFMKQLKDLDKNLGCTFNHNAGKFVITYKRATGQPVPLMQVVSESGGFRQPDRREIEKLKESDTHRVSMKERLNIASRYMQEYRENKEREARENIRYMTLDDKLQLRSAIGRCEGPKCDSSIFPKITPKSKGKIF